MIEWQGSDAGKAVIKANKSKLKEEYLAKKRKSEEGEGNTKTNGRGEDDKVEKTKLQKKDQAAVAKAAKKLVASLMEAERAECAVADLSLEAAIKCRGGLEVSATSVVFADEEAVAEKELAQKQTALKISSVKSRINKLKKDVSFSGSVHPAPPVVGKR